MRSPLIITFCKPSYRRIDNFIYNFSSKLSSTLFGSDNSVYHCVLTRDLKFPSYANQEILVLFDLFSKITSTDQFELDFIHKISYATPHIAHINKNGVATYLIPKIIIVVTHNPRPFCISNTHIFHNCLNHLYFIIRDEIKYLRDIKNHLLTRYQRDQIEFNDHFDNPFTYLPNDHIEVKRAPVISKLVEHATSLYFQANADQLSVSWCS